MCLVTNLEHPIVAEKPITCYKVVKHPDDRLYSYWYSFVWEMDKVHTTTLQEKKGRKTIHQGFHSYKDLYSTTVLMTHTSYPCVVIECIIPEGAKYYVGKDDDKLEGYASDKLIPIKLITQKEYFAIVDSWYPYRTGQIIKIESKRIPSNPGIYKITEMYIDNGRVKIILKSPEQIGKPFSRSYLMDTDFKGNTLNKNESIIVYGNNSETE